MTRKLLFVFLFAFSFNANAQDPLITKAYQKLYGRSPSTAAYEYDKYNYNNGKWGSYCELLGHIVQYNNRKSGKSIGDPWIYRIYCELYNEKIPSATELNIYNYNGGQWASYDILKKAIQDYNSPKSSQPPVTSTPNVVIARFNWGEFDQATAVRTESYNLSNGNTLVVFYENQIATSASLFDGTAWLPVEKLVAAGAGNLVAAGAGNLKIFLKNGSNLTVSWPPNLVAAGAGNLISESGSTLVTAGPGNLLPKLANIMAAGERNLFSTSEYKVVKTRAGNFKLKSK